MYVARAGIHLIGGIQGPMSIRSTFVHRASLLTKQEKKQSKGRKVKLPAAYEIWSAENGRSTCPVIPYPITNIQYIHTYIFTNIPTQPCSAQQLLMYVGMQQWTVREHEVKGRREHGRQHGRERLPWIGTSYFLFRNRGIWVSTEKWRTDADAMTFPVFIHKICDLLRLFQTCWIFRLDLTCKTSNFTRYLVRAYHLPCIRA